jgi:hypothetical protein
MYLMNEEDFPNHRYRCDLCNYNLCDRCYEQDHRGQVAEVATILARAAPCTALHAQPHFDVLMAFSPDGDFLAVGGR